MNKHLIRLLKAMAGLYPTAAASAMFMAELGMRSNQILVEQPPGTRWYSIIDECNKSGLIPALLELSLADYPKNQELIEVELALATVVVAPLYDLTKVIPPTDTGKPLDRILGGRVTTSFPDCVAVGDKENYFCSGTLIAPGLVISAKHCASREISRVFANGVDVREVSNSEVLGVAEKILHPSADLMLLVLSGNSTVPPRKIATEIDAPTMATLVGFGTTDFEGTVGYGVKRRVDTPIVSLLCGGQEDSKDFGCVMGVEMVAGHRGLNRDSCRGDSGGGLYIQDKGGEYLLLGVTSRGVLAGRTCGDGGIYTRLDKFSSWILESVA